MKISSPEPTVLISPSEEASRPLQGPRSHGDKQIPELDPDWFPPIGRAKPLGHEPGARRALAPAELVRALRRRLDARRGPVDAATVTRLVAFVLSRGLIEDRAWSSVAHLQRRLPRRKVTLFDQQLEVATSARARKLSTVPAVKGFIEEGCTISEDQISCLVAMYGRLELHPKARRTLESIFRRIALGPHEEDDKRRYVGELLALEAKRLRGAPLDARAIDKAAVLLRIGGLSAEARASFADALSAHPLTPEAAARAAALQEEPARGEPAEWTYYVHIEGRGTLKQNAVKDVLDLEAVGSSRGRFHIVALVTASEEELTSTEGWRPGARLLHIRKSEESGCVVSSEVAVDRDSPLGEMLHGPRARPLDPADPKVLRAAVEYVKQAFPSKHLLVDLWGHGSRPGARTEGQGTIISARDLAPALSGLGIDVLSCNACTMGTYEASLAAEEAGIKYFAASEHTVPGVGVKYAPLFEYLSAKMSADKLGSRALARGIVDHYVAQGAKHTAFSAIELRKLVEVRRALSQLALTMIEAGGLVQNIWLRECWEQTLRVYRGDDLDLGDLARRISARFDGRLRRCADELLQAVAKSCYTRRTTPGDPEQDYGVKVRRHDLDDASTPTTGLAIYGPRDRYDSEYQDSLTAWGRGPWLDLIKTLFPRPDPHRPVPGWAVPPELRRSLQGRGP